MTDQEFNEEMDRILAKIGDLPAAQREAVYATVNDTRKRHAEIQEATARTYAALDDWRLIQKYRIFDAEAQRREAQAERKDCDQAE